MVPGRNVANGPFAQRGPRDTMGFRRRIDMDYLIPRDKTLSRVVLEDGRRQVAWTQGRLGLFKVKVEHHTTTETIRVRAHGLDDSLTQALLEMESRGVPYRLMDAMSSVEEA